MDEITEIIQEMDTSCLAARVWQPDCCFEQLLRICLEGSIYNLVIASI